MKSLISSFVLFSLFFIIIIIDRYTHLVGLEPMTSPSTLLFQGEEVPFELELIGLFCILEQSKENM